MATKPEILENFKTSISDIWEKDGENIWPVDINTISHLFIDTFFEELIDDIKELEKKGLTLKQIAQLFETPERIIRLILPLIQGMNKLKIGKEKKEEYILYFLSLVNELKFGDPCNMDGRNLILSPLELKDLIYISKLNLTNGDSSILVQKLCGILWAYSETLYFKTHGFIREFHGPYILNDTNEMIVIRDFFSLTPIELWDECSNLNFSKCRLITVYQDLDLSIDIYNHIFLKPGNSYVKNLKYYHIECDGKKMNLKEINELCSKLSIVIGEVHNKVGKMDWKKRAEKYSEIFWYSKKKLRDFLGKKWSCPNTIKQRIETGTLETKFSKLSKRELKLLLRFAF